MNTETFDFEQARSNMIKNQIRPWHVLNEEVLNTMFLVHRELFVPIKMRNLAFSDLELPLEIDKKNPQNMLFPKLEARLMQELSLTKSDSVLEIGTGSGYQSALMSKLSQRVTSIEINPILANFAKKNLEKNNIKNVQIEIGDASNYWSNKLYNAILLTGSLPVIPKNIKKQLCFGGRMVAIIGNWPIMTALRITRDATNIFKTEMLFETLIKPLQGNFISNFDLFH